MIIKTDRELPREIEVYEVGARRLYAKTREGSFAIFEDELTPEELMAIAKDIAARRAHFSQRPPSTAPSTKLRYQAAF